jgi:Flp pilus assembly pilin Flp
MTRRRRGNVTLRRLLYCPWPPKSRYTRPNAESRYTRPNAPGSPRNERGASATEYGLLAVAVAAVIAFTVFAFGEVVTDLFNNSCETIDSQTQTDECTDDAEEPAGE